MEMDDRAAKLALARKKLKDHQEKKQITQKKDENIHQERSVHSQNTNSETRMDEHQNNHQNEIEHESKENYIENVNSQQLHSQDISVTELLISNKRNLEMQVIELQTKLVDLDSKYKEEISCHNNSKRKICLLENEVHMLNDNYTKAIQQLQLQNEKNEELNYIKSSLTDKNNILLEKLEFTKTILTAKETENASLHSQLDQLTRELHVTQLQLQQLNGPNICTPASNGEINSNQKEELLQKVDNLEQQLKLAQKERDQINLHYEHYVNELNEQLKLITKQNEEFSKQINHLSNRENSLVEQISEMEIRIQNLQMKSLEKKDSGTDDIHVIQNEYYVVQKQLQEVTLKYEQLQKMYAESEAKVNELQEAVKIGCDHNDISITKLTADIASDKIAAQKATEQNKKLKKSMQELEEAFVKMSEHKLQLTEKITAEKFLNRELTIKLAECEDKCKDMQTKLMAKDGEMIRIQNNYRDLEKEYTKISNELKKFIESPRDCTSNLNNDGQNNTETNDIKEKIILPTDDIKEKIILPTDDIKEKIILPTDENVSYTSNHVHQLSCDSPNIPKEDAMKKLQERFLKIMSEVADLSDEKHRLEHIILQLQNETDTICEYVALYQQQRSLLKKRDEERSAQIKRFQIECEKLKRQLEELSGILIKFAEDKELAVYFQVETRKNDMEKVRSLLFNLKTNSLVDPKRSDLELSNVYPCNCCSGNLIDV